MGDAACGEVGALRLPRGDPRRQLVGVRQKDPPEFGESLTAEAELDPGQAQCPLRVAWRVKTAAPTPQLPSTIRPGSHA